MTARRRTTRASHDESGGHNSLATATMDIVPADGFGQKAVTMPGKPAGIRPLPPPSNNPDLQSDGIAP